MTTRWHNDLREFLETDGLGGFASGTVSGPRTRRYHGLLQVTSSGGAGRVMLVNGVEAWVTTDGGTFALSAHHYAGGSVTHPNGNQYVENFVHEPWPVWRFRLPDGTVIEQELLVPHGKRAVAMRWRMASGKPGTRLTVRPLMSGRDYHGMHAENGAFRFQDQRRAGVVRWEPYYGVPAIEALANGSYRMEPLWLRNFWYAQEANRGFDAHEDLASPGVFTWELGADGAVLMFSADGFEELDAGNAVKLLERWRGGEAERRRALGSPLERAADQYLITRGQIRTIIAGYPWFTDWGRDTFIAIRGLCLATGRFEDARQILLAWSNYVSRGMLPNRFPDAGAEPEYNSVDASLWYVIAVYEFLQAMGKKVAPRDAAKLRDAVQAILRGYAQGTRHGIRMDQDGLLFAGELGVQLTWMDAKIGEWVVTPRTGKPVEIQALWLNALSLAIDDFPEWQNACAKGCASFRERFWNAARGCLYDVVDVDGEAGKVDSSIRPNQILAVGGLPLMLLPLEQAKLMVQTVERELFTPAGLRSLAPGEKGYAARYEGGPVQRDATYHQGTVWGWLMGPFVEAWVRVGGSVAEARQRFLAPLMALTEAQGLGHICEIADAEAPHTPRGCPFQAWSTGELLRLDRVVLASAEAGRGKARAGLVEV